MNQTVSFPCFQPHTPRQSHLPFPQECQCPSCLRAFALAVPSAWSTTLVGQLSAQMPGSTLAPQVLYILSPCSNSIHMSSCGSCLPLMLGLPWVPQCLSRPWLSLTGCQQTHRHQRGSKPWAGSSGVSEAGQGVQANGPAPDSCASCSSLSLSSPI